MITKRDFCSRMDHTCLGWICTEKMVKQYCDEVIEFGFASVCVNPDWVAYCAKRLEGRAGICCVIGFPQGANSTTIKIAEGIEAIDNGATDLDVVTNLSWLRDGRDDLILYQYKSFISAIRAKKPDTVVKIIMYAPYGKNPCLTEDETRCVSEMIATSGADYIKFCCDPAIIKRIVGDRVKMKFAGTFTFESAMDAIEKGCDRVGEDKMATWLRERGDVF